MTYNEAYVAHMSLHKNRNSDILAENCPLEQTSDG